LPGLAATTAWSWSSTINEVNAADIKYSQRTLTNTKY
jgi:hypothetical protein